MAQGFFYLSQIYSYDEINKQVIRFENHHHQFIRVICGNQRLKVI
jgi:hypothetical protein